MRACPSRLASAAGSLRRSILVKKDPYCVNPTQPPAATSRTTGIATATHFTHRGAGPRCRFPSTTLTPAMRSPKTAGAAGREAGSAVALRRAAPKAATEPMGE